jgi:hypothetical protein
LATGSLETVMYLYQPARRHIPEDSPIPFQKNISPLFAELGLLLEEESDVKSENL